MLRSAIARSDSRSRVPCANTTFTIVIVIVVAGSAVQLHSFGRWSGGTGLWGIRPCGVVLAPMASGGVTSCSRGPISVVGCRQGGRHCGVVPVFVSLLVLAWSSGVVGWAGRGGSVVSSANWTCWCRPCAMIIMSIAWLLLRCWVVLCAVVEDFACSLYQSVVVVQWLQQGCR